MAQLYDMLNKPLK